MSFNILLTNIMLFLGLHWGEHSPALFPPFYDGPLCLASERAQTELSPCPLNYTNSSPDSIFDLAKDTIGSAYLNEIVRSGSCDISKVDSPTISTKTNPSIISVYIITEETILVNLATQPQSPLHKAYSLLTSLWMLANWAINLTRFLLTIITAVVIIFATYPCRSRFRFLLRFVLKALDWLALLVFVVTLLITFPFLFLLFLFNENGVRSSGSHRHEFVVAVDF